MPPMNHINMQACRAPQEQNSPASRTTCSLVVCPLRAPWLIAQTRSAPAVGRTLQPGTAPIVGPVCSVNASPAMPAQHISHEDATKKHTRTGRRMAHRWHMVNIMIYHTCGNQDAPARVCRPRTLCDGLARNRISKCSLTSEKLLGPGTWHLALRSVCPPSQRSQCTGPLDPFHWRLPRIAFCDSFETIRSFSPPTPALLAPHLFAALRTRSFFCHSFSPCCLPMRMTQNVGNGMCNNTMCNSNSQRCNTPLLMHASSPAFLFQNDGQRLGPKGEGLTRASRRNGIKWVLRRRGEGLTSAFSRPTGSKRKWGSPTRRQQHLPTPCAEMAMKTFTRKILLRFMIAESKWPHHDDSCGSMPRTYW